METLTAVSAVSANQASRGDRAAPRETGALFEGGQPLNKNGQPPEQTGEEGDWKGLRRQAAGQLHAMGDALKDTMGGKEGAQGPRNGDQDDNLDNNQDGEEDKEVLARMQAGEGGALEELWRRYAGLLYTQALRVLHNPSEAEDVVVEVFSEAWKRASSYHPERARPVAWLVTLVRRRAIDHLRERRSHERAEARLALDGDVCLQGAAEGDHHSEEMVRLAELRWLLDQALRRLPQNQRETVCMVYFEGLTQKEIAARTKTPLGTVKTRLELGMRKLRDRIRCTRVHAAGLPLGRVDLGG